MRARCDAPRACEDARTEDARAKTRVGDADAEDAEDAGSFRARWWNGARRTRVVRWRRDVVSVLCPIVALARVVLVVRVVRVARVGETTRALDAEGCLRDGAGRG